MSKLRLIHAGIGGFGKTWLSVIAKSADFECVAFVDPSADAIAAATALVGGRPGFASLESALANVEADAVLTVTPPSVHLEHARLCFARGLHLMTEKPIATDLAAAREMVRLADDAGRQLVVSQNYRYRPPVQTLARLVREAPLGPLGHVHIDFYIPADFTGSFRETMPHVLLVDMAIHHLDMLRAITGRDVRRLVAQTFRPAWSWYQHNPGLMLMMELDGGAMATYRGDWTARGRQTSWNGAWRLQCEHGSMHLDETVNSRITLARSSRGFAGDVTEQTMLFDTVPLEGQHATLASFAEAIRAGKPAPTSGRDNLASFGIVQAAVESAETGAWVDLR